MSKAYIPSVVFVGATGTGMVNIWMTGPFFSGEAAHAPVPTSSSARAAATANVENPKYFNEVREALRVSSISSSQLV